MKRLLLGASLATLSAGAVCLLTVVSDSVGDQRLSARRVGDLALLGLVLPHLAVVPLWTAGRVK